MPATRRHRATGRAIDKKNDKSTKQSKPSLSMQLQAGKQHRQSTIGEFGGNFEKLQNRCKETAELMDNEKRINAGAAIVFVFQKAKSLYTDTMRTFSSWVGNGEGDESTDDGQQTTQFTSMFFSDLSLVICFFSDLNLTAHNVIGRSSQVSLWKRITQLHCGQTILLTGPSPSSGVARASK
eukprot:SAG31_NODE_7591_length_1645_cov_84.368047_2_plen_181_part_00